MPSSINAGPYLLTVSGHISQTCPREYLVSCEESLAALSVTHLPVPMLGLKAPCADSQWEEKEPGKKLETQETNKVMTRDSNELRKINQSSTLKPWEK